MTISDTAVTPGVCLLHGQYLGTVCPRCSTTTTPQQIPQAGMAPSVAVQWVNPYDPVLQRIAVALEQIAVALASPAKGPPSEAG